LLGILEQKYPTASAEFLISMTSQRVNLRLSI